MARTGAAGLAAALALWPGPPAMACQCAPTDEAAAFQAARSVFVARIIAVRRIAHDAWEADFASVGILKGSRVGVKQLRTGGPRAYCAAPLHVGAHYLVFAGDETVVSLSVCGPSRQLARPPPRQLPGAGLAAQ